MRQMETDQPTAEEIRARSVGIGRPQYSASHWCETTLSKDHGCWAHYRNLPAVPSGAGCGDPGRWDVSGCSKAWSNLTSFRAGSGRPSASTLCHEAVGVRVGKPKSTSPMTSACSRLHQAGLWGRPLRLPSVWHPHADHCLYRTGRGIREDPDAPLFARLFAHTDSKLFHSVPFCAYCQST